MAWLLTQSRICKGWSRKSGSVVAVRDASGCSNQSPTELILSSFEWAQINMQDYPIFQTKFWSELVVYEGLVFWGHFFYLSFSAYEKFVNKLSLRSVMV